MGLGVSKIFFEKGLPSFELIRIQFKKQTGLVLCIKAAVNLVELPLNSREVVEKLNHDIDRYEEFKKKQFSYDLENMYRESWKINFIDSFRFYNLHFYEIDFHIKEKTIEIEHDAGCFYFVTSLYKTLHDLGGRYVGQKNENIDWEFPKKWKNLKHWEDYKWYNRPRK